MTDEEFFERLLGVTLKPYQRQLVRDMRAGKRVLYGAGRRSGHGWLDFLSTAPMETIKELAACVALFDEIREFFE